jgi:pimeloyl-ACP methyl ester carboxylesterase
VPGWRFVRQFTSPHRGDAFAYIAKHTACDGVERGRSRWVVCFRGTATLRNMATDIQAATVAVPSCMLPSSLRCLYDRGDVPEAHAGFLESYLTVRADVLCAVRELALRCEPLPIVVTGHSLGGALATLCAWDIAVNLSTAAGGPAATLGPAEQPWDCVQRLQRDFAQRLQNASVHAPSSASAVDSASGSGCGSGSASESGSGAGEGAGAGANVSPACAAELAGLAGAASPPALPSDGAAQLSLQCITFGQVRQSTVCCACRAAGVVSYDDVPVARFDVV